MNSSTIRTTPMLDQLQPVSDAGWDGIELWIGDLEKYEADGGNLNDLRSRLRDLGLMVPNVIGLWNALPATPEKWEQTLPVMRESVTAAGV